MKLSILICSLERRKQLLGRLLFELDKQKNNDVEIITSIDNGIATLGSKRNKLLQQAKGDYISFIDDDDLISENYVKNILLATENKPDCCSLEGVIFRDMNNPKRFVHSLRYNSWYEQCGIYYRCPNHLNAVKREIASRVGFPEINSGEDRDFSTKLYSLLQTECYINNCMYYYLFNTKKNFLPLRSFMSPQQTFLRIKQLSNKIIPDNTNAIGDTFTKITTDK